MKVYFDNKGEFHKYMVRNRPREVWFDDFSTDYPYIVIENYIDEENKFIGLYNKQCGLSGSLDWMGWLFEFKELYVKVKL